MSEIMKRGGKVPDGAPPPPPRTRAEPPEPPPSTRSGPTPDLPEIERLQAVELKPGDVIVATLARDVQVSDQDLHGLQAALGGAFPGHNVVVLAGGMELTVQRLAGGGLVLPSAAVTVSEDLTGR